MYKNLLLVCLRKAGAAPTFSIGMAEGFAHNGFNVYVILSSAITNKEEWDDCKYVKEIYYLNNGDKIHFIEANIKYFIKEKKKIKKTFKDINFDYVICTMPHPWATSVMKIVSSNKLLSVCHDPSPHSGENQYSVQMSRWHYKSMDKLIVLTEAFRGLASQNFKIPIDDVYFMPHGKMSTYKKKQILDGSNWYKQNNINFLFFGKIEKYKGLNILAIAYKIVSSKIKNVTLTIAGNGTFNEYLKEFSSLQNVRIVNKYIPDNEVGKYFDGPNIITVLPYLDATQSGIIPIAMEYESPIITSNLASLKAQLNNGKIGYYFQSGSSRELADIMISVANDVESRNLQIELMRTFLNELNWVNIIKKFCMSLSSESVYEKDCNNIS
ncbi:MAG: hypothetical protein K0S01_1876 [Herbinix sp.]|nr:hypothetical protein [Herbinix sp.]